MANQTIPIVLTAAPVPAGFQAADINQLMTAIATYISGAIREDVTFIPQVVNDPSAFQGQLIFNVPQRVFKGWNAGTGTYVAVTEYQIGDIKNTFTGTDDLAHGWVILDGRTIASITGITGAQQQALNDVFNAGAPGGSLPVVTPANVNALPANGWFSGIPWPPSLFPTFQPGPGVIGGLTVTNPPTGPEVEALRDETEILREASDQAWLVTKQLIGKSEGLLEALNQNTTPPIYAAIFVGYA